MRRSTRAIVTISTVLLLAATVSANAGTLLEAEVPFDFHVGDLHLPQGVYEVELGSNGLLRFLDAQGAGVTAVMTIPKRSRGSANTAQLVFDRYGDDYVLNEIRWAAGRERQILRKRSEAEMAREARTVAVNLRKSATRPA